MKKFVFPFPPSVNNYWRHVVIGRSVRVLISREGREFRDKAVAAVGRVDEQMTGKVEVIMRLCPPNRIRRDVDNYSKAVLDALTHAGVWVDDNQVKRITVEFGPVVPGGRADVVVRDYVPLDWKNI